MKLNEILNMNPIVITSQKPTIHTKIERNEHKHTTKESHQTTREKAKRRKKTKIKNNQKTSNKMTVSTYLSTITLNINGINIPIKRHIVIDWMKTQDPSVCCLQKTRAKDKFRLKMRRYKKFFMQVETN